ncbi:MAG: radical SAM protein [Oscillospiraceae bacterium]|nr:radical SAM protein [Oscillospiraceae bacterium]
MTDYYISITNRCNLNCSYCYEKKLNTDFGIISDETADAVIRFIKERGTASVVYFFGGEPLLGKEIIKKLTHGIHACEYVITTNGTLLDEDFIKFCSENNVRINVSHDGRDCSSRGIKAEDLNEKIRLLQKYQPEVLAALVYTEETLDSLPDNIRYFRDLGIKTVSAVLEESTCPSDIEGFGDRMLKAWREVSVINGIDIIELNQKAVRILNGTPKKCTFCHRKMYINWDGNIYPCLQFQNRAEYRCGNVYDGLDYTEAERNHPDYSGFPEKCAECEVSRFCDNSCACRKMASSGSLNQVSEAFCIEQQILILTQLEKMEHIGTRMENLS